MIEAKEIILWFKEDNSLSWRDIIYRIVKEENIDPWDVDVSLLAKEYLNTLTVLQELDFQISGDIILTAAILLKYKSKKLVEENLKNFEELLSSADEEVNFFVPDFFEMPLTSVQDSGFAPLSEDSASDLLLKPRIPQSRKRKVYLNDLIDALENALSVKKKHYSVSLRKHQEVIYEKNSLFDIRDIVNKVFEKLLSMFKKLNTKRITYSSLVTDSRSERIQTFVALVHLDFHQKVELRQDKSFGDIAIYLKDKENNIKI